ncbi:hypothetical protein DRQ25_01645 [Candidatus Fermentibacteria bacterium]|nr:MAG: hypothetical protein DRQ25_01645 [Candidatus Fermentibacteria bacterium]
MNYTVYYKPVENWRWTTLENVAGDGFITEAKADIRFFILEDHTRIEIPCKGVIFKFGPDRLESIKQSMEEKKPPVPNSSLAAVRPKT